MKRYKIDEGVDVRTLLGVKGPALYEANMRKTIKKAMYESQGADEQVNRLTADLTEKIMDGYAEQEFMTFEFKMKVDYKSGNGSRRTVSVPVELTPDYFEDLGVGDADTDDRY